MLTAFGLVLVLILLNALCVAAEFAAVGAREGRIRKAAERGSRAARLLLPVMLEPPRLDRYISTCQFGITTTSLGAGAVCEYSLASRLGPLFESWGSLQGVAAHSLASAVVLVFITFLQVVFGEQMPKSLALHRPDAVALFTASPVVVLQRIIAPVIIFLNGTAQLVLRLIRAPSTVHRHVHSRQEIDLIMEQSHLTGGLKTDQHERLQHVLELEVVTARQLMVPRREIIALEFDTDTDVAMQTILEGRHTRVPVYRGNIDDIVGFLHLKDIARNAVERGSIKDWRRLIRPTFFVNEGMTADRLLSLLREKRTQQAIVMDEFGGVAGLVTIEDVLRSVFGEVGDESSAEQTNPQRLPGGQVRLPGRWRLDDVEEWIGCEWEGTATPVSGFLTERIGHLPEAGEKLTIDGIEVLIESVENRVVNSVLATPAPTEQGADDGG